MADSGCPQLAAMRLLLSPAVSEVRTCSSAKLPGNGFLADRNGLFQARATRRPYYRDDLKAASEANSKESSAPKRHHGRAIDSMARPNLTPS